MSLPGYVVVEAGPFNGPDDPDASMQWVDITGYVNDNLQLPTAASGRQTDLSTVDPGQFTITLNNQDNRFTPGNTSSPYYPGWRTGMRLRMRETVGSRTFILADGNLLQPSVTIHTPGADQTVTVTAVDRVGRLQQSRRFVSTLTEWVRYNATNLAAYWPLTEPAGARQAGEISGMGQPLLLEGVTIGQPASLSTYIFNFGQSTAPAGDDGSYPTWNPLMNTASTQAMVNNRLACRNLGMTISGTSYAVVGWVKADPTNLGSYQTLLLHDNGGTNTLQIGVTTYSVVQLWQLQASGSGGSVIVNGGVIKFGQWQMVGARFVRATGAVEFWVDDQVFTGTTGGATSGGLDVMVVEGDSPNMSVAQVQIYNGGDYTHTNFLAQLQAGRTGLAGQYTGALIRTIALYAGMPAGELSEIDAGTSMMGRVSLAGKTALDAMRDAETTEQGLLHARGRTLVFHDRTRRYNR